MQPFNVWRWLLLLEDLADLVAQVVVQQLRPDHRHEHRSHHDCHANLVITIVLGHQWEQGVCLKQQSCNADSPIIQKYFRRFLRTG